MKKFVFRLEALLRIRRMQEDEAQAQLSQAIRQYQEATRELERLETKRNLLVTTFQQSQQQIQQVELLKNYYYYFDKLNGDIISQQTKVQASEEQRACCLRQLEVAVQNRKVVEKLKESQYSDYQTEMQKQEQTVLDELGMQVYLRNN